MWGAVPPSAPVRAHLSIAITLTLLGCGYGLVRPDQSPVDRLTVGTIEDTTAQGDLGLTVAQALHAGLAHRTRPVLDPKGPELGGVVRLAHPQIQALNGAGAGLSAISRVDVSVTLTLRGRAQAPLWTGPPSTRTARWPRAATPIQTRDQRRLAIHQAAREASGDALMHFLEHPLEAP